MTQMDEIITAFQIAIPGQSIKSRQIPVNDTVVTIPADFLHGACRILVHTFDFYHLSTITGLDTGSEIELLYHFWNKVGLTLRVMLPYTALRVDTLTDLLPGALFYEREIAEMLGVAFHGLVDVDPLFLPDDWDGKPPLRKGET